MSICCIIAFFILGILLSCIIIIGGKLINYNNRFFEILKNIPIKKPFQILLYILSLDYLFSKTQKSKIKEQESQKHESNNSNESNNNAQSAISNSLAKYIKSANTMNLIFSFVIVMLGLLRFLNCELLNYILCGLIIYRLCSRTLEINVSFICDITSNKQDSSLDKFDRIKLAFKSLVEEAILFSGAYFLIFNDVKKAILGGAHSLILSRFTHCLQEGSCFLIELLTLYQVFCSLVLVTICFAGYISRNEVHKEKNGRKRKNNNS